MATATARRAEPRAVPRPATCPDGALGPSAARRAPPAARPRRLPHRRWPPTSGPRGWSSPTTSSTRPGATGGRSPPCGPPRAGSRPGRRRWPGPADADGVAACVRLAAEHGVPLTPAAGRSGVCGGAVPVAGGVALDLTGLAGIVDVDDTSLRLRVLPGTFGDDLERDLAEYGVTLGHWPQSMAISTVGGWLACRSAGQYSTRYGKIEDMVIGLEVVDGRGRRLPHRRPPPGGHRARPHPGVRRQRGDPRGHHRGDAAGPAPAGRAAAGPPTRFADASPTASTPAAGRCGGAPPRPCCASTTRPSRPGSSPGTIRRGRLPAARPRRGRPGGGRLDAGASSTRSAAARPAPPTRTGAWSATGWSTATTSRPSGMVVGAGLVVDTDRGGRRAGRSSPASTTT